MPEQRPTLTNLARTAERARATTAERDRIILALREQGLPLRRIADAAGLTHPAVLQIVRRHARTRPTGGNRG